MPSKRTLLAHAEIDHLQRKPLLRFEFPYIASKPACYDLKGFSPLKIDENMQAELGLGYQISRHVASELLLGSEWFARLYETRNLTAGNHYIESTTDPDEELEIHNYTGLCPTNVLEVSPSSGSCAVGCQYRGRLPGPGNSERITCCVSLKGSQSFRKLFAHADCCTS